MASCVIKYWFNSIQPKTSTDWKTYNQTLLQKKHINKQQKVYKRVVLIFPAVFSFGD